MIDICVAIIISFTTAIMWTCAHLLPPDGNAKATDIKGTTSSSQGRRNADTTYNSLTTGEGPQARKLWHIKPPDKIDDSPKADVVSPVIMVIVGMGLVYAIYPGIASGDLSSQAGTLSTNAKNLYDALSGTGPDVEAAKEKVTALKNAASNSSDPKGLEQLLEALKTGLDVVVKAKGVLAKYNEVATEYGKVAADVEVQKKQVNLTKLNLHSLHFRKHHTKAPTTPAKTKPQPMTNALSFTGL
ncbi:Tpr-related protein family member, putative [Theileria annulata]|uniref:Tpr-related protein family member, putative n=1 Tax=Theileria annulata TaxID=5874 RepID=Q4UEW6_THEAN|nr:Tpr-related protein family member, putative [Theileria annulata]CAI74373.1 Tpr-related protein family member, putative [Theileria annulata]|eukprot:XP_952105.1 Tpr-related protein family member, putative [Theileria annulata]